ncbi:MAG: response regulator transcription factor [Rhodospirillales bacterium]|nr:response regulator transcription factor [Rhodospirillales bacterium]
MNVLITEDDPLHRSFLKMAIEHALPECERVFEAEDGLVAIEIVAREEIYGVVMDLQMPRASGVDAAKEIWRKHPDMRILFWSNYADEAYVRGVARIVPSGAVYGYLLKSASEERLELAVRGVFQEDQCIIDREVRGVQQRSANILEGLTDSEFEVLTDIALGMTDKAIAAWRKISTRGVQSRLKHLYEKLGIDQSEVKPDFGPLFNSRTRAVALAMSRGLLNVDGLGASQEDLEAWLATKFP